MKLVKYIAILIVIATTSTGVWAQGMFEGEIKLNTVNKDLNETAQITWLVKGNKHKMVFNTVSKGEPYTYTLVFDANSLNAVMLAEVKGQKARYDIPLSSMTNPAMAAYYKMVETEQTGSVAGYATKQFVIESPGSTTICQAAEVNGLKMADLPIMLRTGGVAKAFADKNYPYIPLSISTIDSRTGEVKFSQNITSVTARAIGENEFVVGPEWVSPK